MTAPLHPGWLSALLVVAGCASSAKDVPGQPETASARLSLDLLTPTVATKDELRAYFVITNTGQAPLWLNGRLLLGSGKSSLFNEVWVEARGPAAARWSCYLRTPAVEPKHYQLLLPGESVGRKPAGPTEDLRCVGLDLPGTYSLTAYYRDGNDRENVPPAPPGSTYLGWQLSAAPVTVQILRGSR